MKKVFLAAFAAALLFSVQSCKRSVDTVAKEFCAEMKSGMEQRDEAALNKCNEAAASYIKGLSEEERKEFEQALIKYAEEMKIDSVYQAFFMEKYESEMMQPGAQAPEVDPNEYAMPDTLSL